MTIGDVIRAERKKLSLTQSQLAQALSVSTQAVSKWERGVGSPDVSQIVPLARVLKISTDRLLDNNDRYKELNHIWQKALFKYEGGDESIYTLIEIEEKALAEYPDDYTFLYRRVVDKFRAATDEDDADKRDDLLVECVGNALYALSKHPNDDSITSTLARVYAAKGERELALECAYKTKNPGALMKFILTGDELIRHKQQLVSKKLNDLLSELSDGGLEFLQAEEDIINVLIPDKNYVWHYDEYLAMIHINRARIYARKGDVESAVAEIELALSIAREKAEKNSRRFTAVIFDKLDEENEAIPLIDQLRIIIKKDRNFRILQKHDRYIALMSSNK